MSYDESFYADRSRATRHAADRLLSVVSEYVSFGSVADVGCGTGTWLAAALNLGASEALGYEGEWINGIALDDDRIAMRALDLELPLRGRSVDLVISLEVAEHLSPSRADGFVADLCAMAPAVLFGAAIPGQGGVNHLNEQWQSYWAGKFRAHGFQPCDVVRPRLWSDDSVPFWYRQNALLYLAPDVIAGAPLNREIDDRTLDLVHPVLWSRANRELDYANALPESVYLGRLKAER